MANMSDKIFPGMSNFQNQHSKHSNWHWGANNSMSVLPTLPSTAPSKLPAEMAVWGCLCPAVMSLRVQPPCWGDAAACLPAGNVSPWAGPELPVWDSPSEGDREGVPPQYSVQWMHGGLLGPKSVTLSCLM